MSEIQDDRPRTVSRFTLTEAELEVARNFIAAGKLPRNFLACYYAAIDQQNSEAEKPEHGVGARGNKSVNSFNALKKAELLGREPAGTYQRVVREMWQHSPDRARQLNLPRPDDPPKSSVMAPPNPTEN